METWISTWSMAPICPGNWFRVAMHCIAMIRMKPIRLTDITESAGVPGPGYGMGCTVGDVDNDGDLDLYVTGYPENILYVNNGDATFKDVSRQANVTAGGWSAGALFSILNPMGIWISMWCAISRTIPPASRFVNAVVCGPTALRTGFGVLPICCI